MSALPEDAAAALSESVDESNAIAWAGRWAKFGEVELMVGRGVGRVVCHITFTSSIRFRSVYLANGEANADEGYGDTTRLIAAAIVAAKTKAMGGLGR